MNWKFWKQAYPEYHESIVNTKTGRAFSGVITGHVNGYVIVKNAKLLSGEPIAQIDGEVLIPLSEVEFVQVVK